MAALWDPDKMADAKASFGRQMRIAAFFIALALIGGAYWIGYETGQLQAAALTCREWLRR